MWPHGRHVSKLEQKNSFVRFTKFRACLLVLGELEIVWAFPYNLVLYTFTSTRKMFYISQVYSKTFWNEFSLLHVEI